MLVGPYVNGAAVLIGGLIGAFLGTKLPERVKSNLPPLFGLCSMGLGIMLIIGAKNMSVVVLALIVGTIIGELICLEKGIGSLAGKMRGTVDKIFPPSGVSHQEFLNQFVAILILFCASGMGVFGSMKEGMTGDPSVLFIKAILDFFTAGIFAATLGYAVSSIAVPLIIVQVSLALLASLIMPLTTPNMLADFSTAGGFIMLATGLRICGIKHFAVANMLPALILVMPFSYFWQQFVA
ncbi:DUF554 domain-containing protein [Actinobacillus equuli]|uniref:DUF554 domain-containing protein n=1 Tax=Actinobacillus equuli TaxID=718 RepID=UPI0024434D41|nr:DUF554 domain-containing protein [Actinobacillus equuli]WGE86382.1 DUF554 domain-containing protein [Actinobacillus equuli subsp. haemolyticus]